MIPAGKMRNQLIIQQRNSGSDAAGQPLTTWNTGTPVTTVWAWFLPTTGRAAGEKISAGQEVSVQTISARIRYRTDITARMRAVEGSTTYEIAAVVQDLSCKEWTDLVLVNGAED